VDFCHEWQTDSTYSVCRKVVNLVAISRCNSTSNGIEKLNEIMDFAKLCEIIVELLLDERHGVNAVPYIEEKCIQLLIDIATFSKTHIEFLVSATVDYMIDKLSSWETWSDFEFSQTLLSYFIVLSATGIRSVQKAYFNNMFKLDNMLMKMSHPMLLQCLLILGNQCVALSTKISQDFEPILAGWVIRCLQSKCDAMISNACRLIANIVEINPVVAHRAFSRVEFEKVLTDIMYHPESYPIVVVSVLRAFALLATVYNRSPFWIYDNWTFHWSCSRYRIITQVDFIRSLIKIQRNIGEPYKFVVLAYCLRIMSSAVEMTPSLTSLEYRTVFHGIFLPEVGTLLCMLTFSHEFQTIKESENSDYNDNDLTDLTNHSLKMELREIDSAYSLYSEAAIKVLYCVIVSYNDNLNTYHAYQIMFSSTPIAETIIYLMMQLPGSLIVQTCGMAILKELAAHNESFGIIASSCNVILANSLVSFSDNIELHMSLCMLVKVLSERSPIVKDYLIAGKVQNILHLVIKSGSPEAAPLALIACVELTDTPERAEAVAGTQSVNICSVTIQLLDKLSGNIRIQVEGLKLIGSLYKSMACRKYIRSKGAMKKIEVSRNFLKDLARGTNTDSRQALLNQFKYTTENLEDTIALSSHHMINKYDNCSIS
jgi:hypothetical protein